VAFLWSGKAMFSNQRFMLVEDKMLSVPYAGLQAVNVEGNDLHIILETGTPILLRLGDAAVVHGALLQWFCTQAAPAASVAAPLAPAVPTTTQFSPDRRHWWDGQQWVDAGVRIPAGMLLSPDGSQWHDGESWRPVPRPPAT
jgi:hypothetical protein